MQEIISFYDCFVAQGSGWVVKEIKKVRLVISTFRLFSGGCTNQDLPLAIIKKRACIVVKGISKESCFLYAIASALVKQNKNAQRKKQYEHLIGKLPPVAHFPVNNKDVNKFEKESKISINVYCLENNVVFPYRITNCIQNAIHINLLLYKKHYYAIRNMSALLSGQTKHSKNKAFVCNYCLSTFVSYSRLQMHADLCKKDGQRFQMPVDNLMEFTNFENLNEGAFVIYADLESMCLPKRKSVSGSGKLVSQSKHVPISIGAIRVCRLNENFTSTPFVHTGEDCIDQFFSFLEREYCYISCILNTYYQPLKMTPQNTKQYLEAEFCNMCRRRFAEDSDKYRDHCHLSGKFRQVLCNTCNLNRANTQFKVNVIFHGLSNYDSHFLINRISRYPSKYISIIPLTSERYLTFSVGNVYFKDSYKFLSGSLEKLVSILREKGDEHFKYVNKYITDKQQNSLMKRKGVFPYNYINSLDVLSETCLPPKHHFYNELMQSDISDEQYAHAQHVWSVFRCKSIKSYLELYLVSDVLLTADVFESFRDETIKDFELDPVHYFSSAHYTLDAFLRKCNPTIELLTDINQYLFFRKALRGGLSVVTKRHAVANNKYMQNYNPNLPSRYIMYLDANNLYGKAMTECLPYSNFVWMSDEELDIESIMTLSATSPWGCFLEVDLNYPDYLHTEHSDYLLAPEKISIPYNELCPFAKYVCDKLNLKRTTNSKKLMSTLLPKFHYVLHYRVLQFYLRMGMQLLKIHNGIKFIQKPFMKPYIDFLSQKRASAKNEFEATTIKLLSNALYGKTIERPENRSKVKLATTKYACEKLSAKPSFKQSKIINRNLVSVEMKYPIITLNKPFFLGVAILELSKLIMYEFHYNFVHNKFGRRAQLLFTDTDSLTYEIETEDVYEDFRQVEKGIFDFSNYPPNHPNYSAEFARVPGLFKDVAASAAIKCFTGLRSKMYSYITESCGEIKVAKGVKKHIVDKFITYADYFNTLMSNVQTENTFSTIRSRLHQVSTDEQRKISLSPFDDKRYILWNKIETLPYGHFQINSEDLNVPGNKMD
jgi:hypothetical protein